MGARTAVSPLERFYRRVEIAPNGCHLWTGTTSGSGARYGYFRPGTRASDPKIPAHRWIYEQLVGPIPDGLELDHVKDRGCISKLCVNPEHLEPVSHAENRRRSRLEVCRSGRHDLTVPANVRFDRQGNRRGCLPCKREKERGVRHHRM